MSTHKNWILNDRWKKGKTSQKRWQARVRDHARQTYVQRSFEDGEKVEARDWIRDQLVVLNSASASVTITTAPTADVLKLWLADLRRRGRRDHYITTSRKIIEDAIDAGVVDLADPAVLGQAEKWVTAATCMHPRRIGNEIKPKTRNLYIATIRAMANWAYGRQHLERNWLVGLQRVKTERPLRDTFTLKEMQLLVAAPHPKETGFLTLVQVMLYTGCRLREALNLGWEHFYWSQMHLEVREGDYDLKGDKERIIPLQGELRRIIKPRAQTKGPLFNAELRAADNSKLIRRFRNALRERGVDPKGRTPHCCRHTWICLMLATGENPPLVRDYAGHEHLSTTADYARMQGRYRKAVKNWPAGVLRLKGPAPRRPRQSVRAAGGSR